MLTGSDYFEIREKLLDKELFVFDMDGTIYLGSRPFGFAIRFIDCLRRSGRRVMFFTNNASRSPEHYLERLGRMGFSPSSAEICTAGDVTCEYLRRHRPGKSVYLVGTGDLYDQFSGYGISMTCGRDGMPLDCAGTPDIVVSSFDTSLTYAKLVNACGYIRAGAEYICTHPDFNCPTETGFVPDSGSIAACITASTGVSPIFFGKPGRETVDMIGEMTSVPREKTVLFGDRMYTDIAAGKRHGILSVLVLTGETSREDAESAAETDRPDIMLPSLAEAGRIMFPDEGMSDD